MHIGSLGWEDPPEKEMATHSQYSRLENPEDRGAWRAVVHGVAKELDVAQQLNNDKRTYTHNGKLLGHKKSKLLPFAATLGGPRHDQTKGSKSDRESQIEMISFVCGI